MHTQIILKLCG